MKYILPILFLFSCTEPLIYNDSYCVEYHIGQAWTRGEVKQGNGKVSVNDWSFDVYTTVKNETMLFRDTTVGTVYQSSTFLFPNNQIGDTIRGMYISHSKGDVCNTYDTLPVYVLRVPCNPTRGDIWH